jgi:hypothetical protein
MANQQRRQLLHLWHPEPPYSLWRIFIQLKTYECSIHGCTCGACVPGNALSTAMFCSFCMAPTSFKDDRRKSSCTHRFANTPMSS